jgi:hypothetical protein
VWLLSGQVQGTQKLPYEVSVELKRSPEGRVLDWIGDCSCPVGEQCKHAISLMIKAAYQGQHVLGESAAAHPFKPLTEQELEAQRQADLAKRQAAAQLESEQQVLHWLDDLARGGIKAPAVAHPVDKADRHEQFLYLLGVTAPQGPNPLLTLEIVVSYPKVSGGWAKAKPVKFQPERGQVVYDLASETDHDVLQLMRTMPGASSSYFYNYGVKSRVTVDGKFGLQALELAASTGRLFVGDGKGQPMLAAQWGPPLDVKWQWHEQTRLSSDDSHWVLRPLLSTPQARLCLNQPPLYLDSQHGIVGLAHVDGISLGQVAVLL